MNSGARIASRGSWIEARASASPKVMLSIRPCDILTVPGPVHIGTIKDVLRGNRERDGRPFVAH